MAATIDGERRKGDPARKTMQAVHRRRYVLASSYSICSLHFVASATRTEYWQRTYRLRSSRNTPRPGMWPVGWCLAGPTQRNACDPATAPRQIRVLAGHWRSHYPCTRAPPQVLLDSWRAVPGAARTSSSYSRHRGSVGTSGAVARPASGGSSPVSLPRKSFRCPKSAGTRDRVPRWHHAGGLSPAPPAPRPRTHARTPCRAHRQRAEAVRRGPCATDPSIRRAAAVASPVSWPDPASDPMTGRACRGVR